MHKRHFDLSKKLSKELNTNSGKFSQKNYKKIQKIDGLLLKKDISAEKKKQKLVEELHRLVVRAFSLKKGPISNSTFKNLKHRMNHLRLVINKLRDINNYLETTFFEDMKLAKARIHPMHLRFRQKENLAKSQLELLEFTAYRMIGEAVVLDKRLLKEYSKKQGSLSVTTKSELKGLGHILHEQTTLMEHLEAKLPPPEKLSKDLLKEPKFTHWVSRVLALLTLIEHSHHIEAEIFRRLKKNRASRSQINKKITQLIKERLQLMNIMEKKSKSMIALNADKKQVRNFRTIISL